ncbi:GntR family transcriptional regulator [Alkalihalobacterium bogoriense]|uniref:GntR family transcriptional regulator n=1 Tax=Alkalihalobacterium bogoriense TaxID=246272 RepID=UPI00047C507D|nr:GntR family transcriptional regulator [Alkalihalobacterium bogoriense]
MFIRIDPKSNVALYEQVIQQIKEMCARGLLKPDDKLPSVRELSAQIVINPNTVAKAYKELERQGVIVTVRGKGTFIAEFESQEVTEKQKNKIKKEIENLIIECKYLGISGDQLKQWVDELYLDLMDKNK